MFAPEQIRAFLRWYEGDGEEPPVVPDQQPPPWLVDRHPWLAPDEELDARLVPLSDYDIKERTTGNPDGDDYIPGPQAGDELVDTWRGTVNQEGFDSIAWYVPFHYSADQYGIYVTERGVQVLGNLLFNWSHGQQKPMVADITFSTDDGEFPLQADIHNAAPDYTSAPFESVQAACELALEILLRHEWYHHQTELLAAYLEDFANEMLYRDYMEQAYRPARPGTDCLEESLANAYVARSRACMRRAPSTPAFHTLFEYSTRFQPDAYRAYDRFTGQDFRVGGRHLAHLVQTADATDAAASLGDRSQQTLLGSRLPFDTSIARATSTRRIPVYVVQPRSPTPNLEYFKYVALETDYNIHRTDDFEKNYKQADNTVRERVDRAVEKLETNVDMPGFNWRNCRTGYQYVRINEQMRMIVDRDDSINEVKLVDFDTDHDLPREYGCYN